MRARGLINHSEILCVISALRFKWHIKIGDNLFEKSPTRSNRFDSKAAHFVDQSLLADGPR